MRLTIFLNTLLFVLGSLSACGGGTDPVPPAVDSGTADSGPVVDSGAPADSGPDVDSGPADDAGAMDDAGVMDDAGSTDDAGPTTDGGAPLSCAPGSSIADRIAGSCDGRGRAICTMWATMTSGVGAVAQCVPPTGVCARADACSASGCTCGAEAECDDDQMCVPDTAGGGFKCACITP